MVQIDTPVPSTSIVSLLVACESFPCVVAGNYFICNYFSALSHQHFVDVLSFHTFCWLLWDEKSKEILVLTLGLLKQNPAVFMDTGHVYIHLLRKYIWLGLWMFCWKILNVLSSYLSSLRIFFFLWKEIRFFIFYLCFPKIRLFNHTVRIWYFDWPIFCIWQKPGRNKVLGTEYRFLSGGERPH